MADEILREDAERQGYVRNKYGYGNYAKKHGILTRHAIVTIKIHESGGNEVDNVERLHEGEGHEDGWQTPPPHRIGNMGKRQYPPRD